MTPVRRGAVLISLALLAGRADGIDETMAGRSLSLRQGKESARLVLTVRAPVVAPLPGGTEDPTIHGGFVEISNPESGEWARLEVPRAGWSMNALGTVFRFRNAVRDARGVRSVVIRHGRKIKVKASTVGITLDERTQGVLAALLATGTRRYCMLFGGQVRRDEPGKFAARDAPAPAACPQLPAEPTTTTTSTRPPTTSSPAPRSTSTTALVTTSSSTSSTRGASTTTTLVTTSSSTSSTREASTTTTRPSTSTTAPPTTSSTKPPTTSSTARPTTTSTSSTTSTTKKPKKDDGNGMGGNGMD